jgi:TonB family protein
MRTILLVSLLLALSATISAQDSTEFISKIVHTPSLTVPDEAIRTGIGGEVTVRVKLDSDGNVVDVAEATGPGATCRQVTRPDVVALRKAAREAAKLAKFEPVVEGGKRKRASGVVKFDIPQSGREQVQTLDLGLLSRPSPNGADNFLKQNARSLPKPPYPPAARSVRAAGPVSVRILIDEHGDVFTVQHLSGHPLLWAAASQAACQAKFKPTMSAGTPVKVSGVIMYYFVP